ncbi:hypothetical protein M5K25_015813 [Dendrobium thyrsiflorum]|uniref:Uncharacterized protein n=1 Tax=Dendrobium thyrsiflorum TaxID=117978 RepID=A0ABD0URL1_DENTH
MLNLSNLTHSRLIVCQHSLQLAKDHSTIIVISCDARRVWFGANLWCDYDFESYPKRNLNIVKGSKWLLRQLSTIEFSGGLVAIHLSSQLHPMPGSFESDFDDFFLEHALSWK